MFEYITTCHGRANATTRTIPAGTMLFEQGHRVRNVELMVSGVVCMQSTVNGQPVLIGLRGSGWALGSIAAVLGTRQTASAFVLRECVVHTLPIAEFHRLRRTDNACAAWLHVMQAREAEDEIRRLRRWVTSSCEERLDHLLAELMALAGEDRPDGSLRLLMPIEVERLGQLTLMRRETASRHVGRRIKEGTLLKHKGWFIIPRTSDLMERVRAERALLEPVPL